MVLFSKPDNLPSAEDALAGRSEPMPVSGRHLLSGESYLAPFAEGMVSVRFGLGCFWGAERLFWRHPEVHVTAVGYAGGHTPNPTYEEVCSGRTGHAEVVLVVFPDSEELFQQLLELFWESHDPTQGMRQGNDRGTQYRSTIFVDDARKLELAEASREQYAKRLAAAGLGKITTEIRIEPTFYYAEDYHQQYLIRVPHGYCGLAGTGICYAGSSNQ